MKHNKISRDQNQKPAGAAWSAAVAEVSNRNRIDFAPSADEVAGRAHFNDASPSSVPGHEVQHWLAAEAELIAEHSLTRVRGFQGRA